MKQCDGTMSMQLWSGTTQYAMGQHNTVQQCNGCMQQDNGAEQHNMRRDNTAQQCDGIQCNNVMGYNATMRRYTMQQCNGTLSMQQDK